MTEYKISCIGIGGGGINAVNLMIKEKIKGVKFLAVDSDVQALESSEAENKILIEKLTAEADQDKNPEIAKKATEEKKDEIAKAIDKPDMVFVTTGFGGETGTGAAPVVAKIAKESGALTIGVVTIPFGFEGRKIKRLAVKNLEKLKEATDAVIVIQDDKIIRHLNMRMHIKEAFMWSDWRILYVIQGITDIICVPGVINIEPKYIREVMKDYCFAGVGIGVGGDRAAIAVKSATDFISSDVMNKASGIICNITGSEGLGLYEIRDVGEMIRNFEKISYLGAVIDEKMHTGEIRVTIFAGGLSEPCIDMES